MCYGYMNRIRQIINEEVRKALNEARSIKSRKLQQIISQYGAPHRGNNRSYDLHNMRDEDIICVMPYDQYQALWEKRYEVDHGRWADNYSLEVWAKNQGIVLEPGDRIGDLPLGNGDNVLLFINRNEGLANGREDGWKQYYDKKEERDENRRMDGAKRYIRQYYDPEYFTMWKNPYKKTNWSRKDIDDTMERIRQRRANGERTKVY